MLSAADGLIVYNADGGIRHINAAAIAMLGYDQDQLCLPMAERVRAVQPERPDGSVLPLEETAPARALRGETVTGSVMVLDPGRKGKIWVSTSAAPIRGRQGETLGAVATFTDITALHDLEEQREDFVRAISHDLRNPLASIAGISEWLLKQLAGKQLEREASAAERIVKSARRVGNMLQELVDSVRLESGAYDLDRHPVDFCRLLEDVRSGLATKQDTERVSIDCPQSLGPALIDAARIERAVVNLVENALKFSPDDQPVVVRVVEESGRVVISVIDRGVGISAEDLPFLFERFFRGRSGKSGRGLGLGLYITRLIMDAHGGGIEVESTPDQGSVFRLLFPRSTM